MTYVKLRLVTLICFTAHTRRHIFLQGLVLIQSASLFVKEGVPVPLEIRKKRMSGDMISYQIWGMKDKTNPVSCVSNRCGLMCTIWLIAVNMARKTNEYSQYINLTPCKQTQVTQLSEYRFNIWCPNLWMHQMFDVFQQGTGSIKIKLGCCQLFGCESTFWGNSLTPKSLRMYMQKYIHSFKVPVSLRLYIWSI